MNRIPWRALRSVYRRYSLWWLTFRKLGLPFLGFPKDKNKVITALISLCLSLSHPPSLFSSLSHFLTLPVSLLCLILPHGVMGLVTQSMFAQDKMKRNTHNWDWEHTVPPLVSLQWRISLFYVHSPSSVRNIDLYRAGNGFGWVGCIYSWCWVNVFLWGNARLSGAVISPELTPILIGSSRVGSLTLLIWL